MGLKERVQDCLGSDIIELVEYRGDLTVEVPKEKIVEILTKLKETQGLQFDFLSDIVLCSSCPGQEERTRQIEVMILEVKVSCLFTNMNVKNVETGLNTGRRCRMRLFPPVIPAAAECIRSSPRPLFI